MDINTIQETFKIPSKGLAYGDLKVPEEITLRSMTTEEEMRRLSQRGTQYKKLSSIIDACVIGELPISVYDMCLGDYQALLYGLRIVTYGSKCINPSICPKCGKINRGEVDLYSLKSIDFEGFEESDFEVTLPKSKSIITLSLQTPRMLDDIDKDLEEYKEKNPDSDLDMSFLYNIKHSIKTIDGKFYDPIKKEAFVKKLLMADTNFLLQKIIKLNDKVGISTDVTEKCSCGHLYDTSFRISSEFFGPTID